jgi:hypothetical protein
MTALVHRRLRAPQDDGAALIDPPLAQVPKLLAANLAKAVTWDASSGAPFSKWREAERRYLVSVCKGQARSVRDLSARSPSVKPHTPLAKRPFILSGHQPTLFHPGVWIKNYLLSALREQNDAAAVNLIIDNDASGSPGILVPSGTANNPRLAFVPLDAPAPKIPWENRPILDLNLFSSFAQRVKQVFSHCSVAGGPILLDRFFSHATDLLHRELKPHGPDAAMDPWSRRLLGLGDLLADARHDLEREIGLKTHEASLSLIAHYQTFRSFADHVFRRAREFHEVYNAALHEYRLVNHIRSRTHPVPDLEVNGAWVEMPFWISAAGFAERRRAFVRQTEHSWDLSDPHGDIAVRKSRANEPFYFDSGQKLRPRALITTMYARLVLSDLFIHGIGGAKYDELTDLIIRRFFGIEPPAYVTATATFRLPIDRPQVSVDDVRRSALRIRELRYRPEAFLRDPLVQQDRDLAPQLAALAAEKRAFLDQHDLRRCAQDVFTRLDSLNRAMHDRLHSVEQELRARHAELIEQAHHARLLGSREFSFVLFPSEILPARLLDLCKVSS